MRLTIFLVDGWMLFRGLVVVGVIWKPLAVVTVDTKGEIPWLVSLAVTPPLANVVGRSCPLPGMSMTGEPDWLSCSDGVIGVSIKEY